MTGTFKFSPFVVCLLCLGAELAAAGNYAVPVFVSAPDTNVVQTITGSIEDVSIADSAKGLRSEIRIAGQGGARPLVLVVKGTTTIYDPAWKPTGLDVLRKKDLIKVKYVTTREGLAEALSIKQLK